MKNFDLEAAKKGAKVCTRDGREARILCYDSNMASDEYATPIVAEVAMNGRMNIMCYTAKGTLDVEGQSKCDLMMADDDYKEKLERGEYGATAGAKHGWAEIADTGRAIRVAGEALANMFIPKTPEQISTKTSDENYWRKMYAGMAMQGLMAAHGTMKPSDMIAKSAVEYADAIIEELKNENQ